MTPNPKLFEQNRAATLAGKLQRPKFGASNNKSRREGENFVGLQTYIISEIDSGSENNAAAPEEKFLSDASSFSNSFES